MKSWYEIADSDSLCTPALLVWPDRIRANLQRMIDAVGNVDQLRPHVKTHKMAEVIAIKRELGIDRFKASTIAEAEMTADAGGADVLLAYPTVGPNIGRFLDLIEAFPQTHFSTLVDDPDAALAIAAQAVARSRSVSLMMDVNVGMGRTGIEPGEDAVRLYELVCRTPGLEAAGLHAYDGHLHGYEGDELRRAVAETFDPFWQLRGELTARSLPVPSVVAGGTPTSIVLAQSRDVEVGAGTIALWDSGQDHLSPGLPFAPAAALAVRVISKPAAGRLCLDLGHKSVASEMPSPRVQWMDFPDAVEVTHSEEHLVIETAGADRVAVGDVLYAIPTHICPTVALHSCVHVVRDQAVTEQWQVVARNRQLRY